MNYLHYEEIFKNNYLPSVQNILNQLLSDINKDNNKIKISLSKLHKGITEEFFTKMQLKSYKEANDLSLARDEVLEQIKELFGSTLYDININENSSRTIDKNILDDYAKVLSIPNTVEEYYFDILDDILHDKKEAYESTDKNLNTLKKDLYVKLDEYIKNYNNNFKDYILKKLPEQFDFDNNKVMEGSIAYINKKLQETEPILTQIKQYIYDYQIKYNEDFNNIYEKRELLKSVNEIKEKAIDENAKKNIEQYITILNKQIEAKQKSIDKEYKIYNSKMELYKSLNTLKQQLIKGLHRLENSLEERLDVLKNFEKEELTKISIEEFESIQNKDEFKIRTYEILKYHIKYSTKILEIYYHIIYNYKDIITEVANRHEKQGNYYDIFISSRTGYRLVLTLQSMLEETVFEYEDIIQKILSIMVYKIITKGQLNKWYNIFSFWDDYKEYIKEQARLSPLAIREDKPKNFMSYTEFKASDKFKKQFDFNEQFNNYKEKFSSYEAKTITRSLIKLQDTGLSEMDALEEFNPAQKSIYFEEDNGVGGVVFVKLSNDKWVVASSLKMLFKIKVYSETDLRKYPSMIDMIFNNDTTFIEAYNFIPVRTIVGKKDEKLDYKPSNKMYYPTVKFMKSKDGKITSAKSSNYDNYIQFWKDFYGEELIKDSLYYYKQGVPHISISSTSFLNPIDKLFTKTLDNYANAGKDLLDVSGSLHTWAQAFLPLYGVIYKLVTDREYEISKLDVLGFIVDMVSILLLFISAKDSVKNLLSKAILEGKSLGIRGKKKLLIYSIRNTPSLKIELSRILAKTTFDAVGPLPFVSLPTRFPRLSKLFRTTFNIKEPNEARIFNNCTKISALNPEWRIKNVITLPEDPIKSNNYYNNVYKVNPESKFTLGEKDYYIKQDRYIYQVEWDDYSYTWRIINQKNPGFSGYKIPVRWDNVAKRWFTHSAAPIEGIRFIESGNLKFISKEEASEISDFLEKMIKDTSNKINSVIDMVIKATPQQESDINKAFEIFMGKYDQPTKILFLENLNKQSIVFNKLNPKKDIIYNGGFDPQHPKSMITTEENSFYNLNKDGKPFIELFVNTLVDLNNNYAYNQFQLSEYISSAFMHIVYNATNLKTNALAYSEIYKHDNILQYNLDKIVALVVPHLRKYETNVIINDLSLLDKYIFLHEDIKKLLVAKNLPKANTEMINALVRTKINEYIIQSDTDIIANPSNTVYLINLLYDLFYNKEKFDKFIRDYNTWFMNINDHLVWEYKPRIAGPINNNMNNTTLGKINNADLQVIKDNLNTYYANTVEPINITFNSMVGTKNSSVLYKKNNYYSFDMYKSNYLNIDEIITCKGSNIKVKSVNDQIKFNEDLNLSDNIGFININNPNNKVIGIKININDVSYGKPIIISHKVSSFLTALYCKKNNYFYAYYSNKELMESLSQFNVTHNNLYFNSFTQHTNNDQSLQYFHNFLNSNYDNSVIHYASNNLDQKLLKDIIFNKVKNIKFIRYDNSDSNYEKNVGMLQSYAVITKNLEGKAKIAVFSERIEMIKEGNSIKNNIVLLETVEF